MSDALTELLRVAGVRGSLISRARLSVPFGVSTKGMPRPVFHAPLRGAAWVRTAEASVFVEAGDVAVIPHAAPHDVLDAPQSACRHISEFTLQGGGAQLPTLVDGTENPAIDLVCGSFQLGAPAHQVLLGPLPSVFAVKGGPTSGAFVSATLALMEQELRSGQVGHGLVSDRLVEVLVVYLLRGWSEQQPESASGWLAGLRDPQLGPLLTDIHAQPSGSWTVQTMARRAGMSRTRFIQRFQEQIGVAPGQWLQQWRFAVGQSALRDGAGIAAAAERAGYSSEASFSRAFKRFAGVSPGAWRRAAAVSA